MAWREHALGAGDAQHAAVTAFRALSPPVNFVIALTDYTRVPIAARAPTRYAEICYLFKQQNVDKISALD
jgi:hypothetical protein